MILKLLPAPALLALVGFAPRSGPQDWVIGAGQTVVYDTAQGPVSVHDLRIEAGGTLRVVGPQAFRLNATGAIEIDGLLDVSGFDASDVWTLNTPQLVAYGGDGAAGGGDGGPGNRLTTKSNAKGGDGSAHRPAFPGGGHGGESGFRYIHPRPGGGGGGALGPDQPVSADPNAPENLGRFVQDGFDGALQAFGVILLMRPPQGGAGGSRPFIDGDPLNDFWGRKPVSGSQSVIVGELDRPVPGAGGGGGGNAIASTVFPNPAWPVGEHRGAGGGGGGGLAILVATHARIGAAGKLVVNGGAGGAGENTLFINRMAGGGGGGSGGMLVLQVGTIDLSAAQSNCVRALGGRGGRGENDQVGAPDAGGMGGPGLLQFHVPNGAADISLPSGQTLDTMTAPTAHVLLPEPGL